VNVFGKKYPNPKDILNRVLRKSVDTLCVPIHGDLHPNNVVLAARGPALIDFAWFKPNMDLYIDFVLMECSLRFLLFPHNVAWLTHRKVNQALLREDGPERAMDVVRRECPPHAYWYRRMLAAVTTIRAAARDAAGAHFDLERYLTSQFIVLYGLSKINRYPFSITTDALGQLAERVQG
jgi:Ternary complex associated domain 9